SRRPAATIRAGVTAFLHALRWLPHVAVTALMLVAMADMLVGVFLRYVVTWVSATFDLPSVRFFWVEEVGEYALAWLTFIGAALGIRRGTHFTVHVVTERLPTGVRRALAVAHLVLLAGFGALLAVFGWQVSELNSQSYSPALDLNLRWLYLSCVAGGVLIAVYSVAGLVEAWRGPGPGAAAEG
ncbi:MAG TPA: TRAP transporter small permease, partial [Methylomirabilota bacterium]|nr:TRAP transporter small permease [Methylomirabilota bacterium]